MRYTNSFFTALNEFMNPVHDHINVIMYHINIIWAKNRLKKKRVDLTHTHTMYQLFYTMVYDHERCSKRLHFSSNIHYNTCISRNLLFRVGECLIYLYDIVYRYA